MSEPLRNPDYSTRFKPGEVRNPHGRTPQSVKLAKRLMVETQDGEEVIQMILGIARGTAKVGVDKNGKPKGRVWSEGSRRWALEIILDRLWGKAKQSIDLEIGPAGPRLNRAALSDEETAVYQRLVRKMSAPLDANPPALELPASAVTEAVATAIALDPADTSKVE